MSFLKNRNFLVERSKKSVRLEIVRAMTAQNIHVTHLIIDKDTPLSKPAKGDNMGWNDFTC